jgi:hypothetical protein
MAARKTPSNGAKPDKLMRDALLLELNTEAKRAGGKPTKRLRLVARKLIERAEQGDVPAIKEIFDRVDGRVPLPQYASNPEGEPVNALHDLFKLIDGTGRGLPDPAKVRLPDEYRPMIMVGPSNGTSTTATVTLPEAAAGQTVTIEAEAAPVNGEPPRQQMLVMPPRRKSLLPDLDKVPSRSN